MAQFECSEAYNVPVKKYPNGGRAIDISALKMLYSEESEFAAILALRGVYIFSMKAGQGAKPWYVGKTQNLNFFKEAFNQRNTNFLNELICTQKGTLMVSFVLQSKGKGKPNLRQIDEIETMLIGKAAERNLYLINTHRTKGVNWSIKGVFNSSQGQPPKSAVAFRKLMNF